MIFNAKESPMVKIQELRKINKENNPKSYVEELLKIKIVTNPNIKYRALSSIVQVITDRFSCIFTKYLHYSLQNTKIWKRCI